MGAAVPLIAADRSVQCCSVTPGDCDVNCACVCFCLCVTALQLTRALTSFALKYCSSEQNHGHTNTKTQSRRWQFQCCSRLACVLLSIYECVYVCVCVYLLQGMWELMFLFRSVLLWSGSCVLMWALLSPRLNSSIIHKTLCQTPGWVYVCVCVYISIFVYFSLGMCV